MAELKNKISEKTPEHVKSRKRLLSPSGFDPSTDLLEIRPCGNEAKRVRFLEWPLSSLHNDGKTSSRLQRSIDASDKSDIGSPTVSVPRTSRFLEGDMDNHMSRNPPPSHTQVAKWGSGESTRGACHDQIEPSKNASQLSHVTTGESSMSRLGKSLAATFNPMHWKIWPKAQQAESQGDETMDLRKRKAETAYAELKSSGQLHFVRSTMNNPALATSTMLDGQHRKHDSGIALNHCKHGTGGSVVFDLAMAIDQDAEVLLDERQGSVRQDLAMTFSRDHEVTNCPKLMTEHNHISLPGVLTSLTDHASPDLATSLSQQVDVSSPCISSNLEHSHRLRNVPSRKDLQKQQRLVKRVSDLEAKLASARRHLAEALREPLPVFQTKRTPFVPGVLPTLPSERLLHNAVACKTNTAHSLAPEDIGRAVSLDVPFAEIHTDRDALGCQSSSIADLITSTNQLQDMAPVTCDNATTPSQPRSDNTLPTGLQFSKKSPLHPYHDDSLGVQESCLSRGHPDSAKGQRHGGSSRQSTTPMHTERFMTQSAFLQGSPSGAVSMPRLFIHTDQENAPQSLDAIEVSTGLISESASKQRKSRSTAEPKQRNDGRLIEDMKRMGGTATTPRKTSRSQPLTESTISTADEVDDSEKNRKKSSTQSEQCIDKDRGLPKCSACKQEFSTRGRLTAHVAKTCKVLRARGTYDESSSVLPRMEVVMDEHRGDTLAMNADVARGRGSVQQGEEMPFEWPADVF